MEHSPLFQKPDILTARNALCIQPHPDDNEFGMGGTIAKLAAAGCRISYLTVTDGDLGTTDASLSPEALARTRRRELEESGRLLGAEDFLSLDYSDGTLFDIPALSREIAEIYRQGRYDFVFCPDPWLNYEAHNDHIVVGRAASSAAIAAFLARYPKETETQPWQITALCFYFTAKPNTVVDVSDTFGLRLAALARHKSQFSPEALETYGQYLKHTASRRGAASGFTFGEAFKVLSPLQLHCIVEAEEL